MPSMPLPISGIVHTMNDSLVVVRPEVIEITNVSPVSYMRAQVVITLEDAIKLRSDFEEIIDRLDAVDKVLV